jgi:hypothetical protein
MRSAGIKMNLLMGVTLSFFLSLTGLLSSRKFTLVGFVLSFLVSLVISVAIGLLVPMRKISNKFTKKFGIKPQTMGARCFEALVSDVIYTPFISFCMVTLAYIGARRQGAQIPYLPMLIKSFLLSFFVAWLLIFTFTPIYFKICFKKE